MCDLFSVSQDDITRRKFLGTAAATTVAATTAAAASETPLPTRILGRTGVRTSILALGCGSRLTSYGDKEKAAEAIHLALDSGIRYLDTAQAYGDGTSEGYVGEVMKTRRKEVFLATKIRERGYDDAMRLMERSMKLLNTDHVDLLHIHNLWDDDDLAAAENGSLKVLYKMRDEGVTRFIGVTSHTYPDTLAKALDRHDFDCTQMALNAAMQGRSTEGENLPPVPDDSFERVALPVAKRKNLGVIAMKVTAQENLIGHGDGKSSIEPLLRYCLSLPVSAAVVGMPKLEFIRENTAIARHFEPMPAYQMREFSTRMADANKLAMDRFFCCHEDA